MIHRKSNTCPWQLDFKILRPKVNQILLNVTPNHLMWLMCTGQFSSFSINDHESVFWPITIFWGSAQQPTTNSSHRFRSNWVSGSSQWSCSTSVSHLGREWLPFACAKETQLKNQSSWPLWLWKGFVLWNQGMLFMSNTHFLIIWTFTKLHVTATCSASSSLRSPHYLKTKSYCV